MKEVLVVIDVQKGTIAPLWGQKKFLQRINSLIDEFHSKGLPVILVRQIGCGPLSARFNRRDTDYVVDKSKPDSFTSSEFTEVLTEIETNNMVITGLMSNEVGTKVVSSENRVGTMHHRITTFFVIYRNKKEFPKMTRNTKGFLSMLNDSYLVLFKFLVTE